MVAVGWGIGVGVAVMPGVGDKVGVGVAVMPGVGVKVGVGVGVVLFWSDTVLHAPAKRSKNATSKMRDLVLIILGIACFFSG